ncbi:hypothetical protein NEOLEDRAFT_342010 [Neolentinus lepideus HHB14362 ss-1]|uniref:Uncharacterized protein n=1 Tax=Neolentinus lepideus HHB14362 ss-1 TaxID=1314782 RepID=A0A165M660_9AGAM|nr:hypothetical protein NEOLEDRAFT_342010 [Neolentinus lepideus HHB14362 ss-1]
MELAPAASSVEAKRFPDIVILSILVQLTTSGSQILHQTIYQEYLQRMLHVVQLSNPTSGPPFLFSAGHSTSLSFSSVISRSSMPFSKPASGLSVHIPQLRDLSKQRPGETTVRLYILFVVNVAPFRHHYLGRRSIQMAIPKPVTMGQDRSLIIECKRRTVDTFVAFLLRDYLASSRCRLDDLGGPVSRP